MQTRRARSPKGQEADLESDSPESGSEAVATSAWNPLAALAAQGPTFGAGGRGNDFVRQQLEAPPAGPPTMDGLVHHMGGLFGADFGRVSLLWDGEAEREGVEAYAEGEQVHLGRHLNDPGTESTRHVLGHELAHVVQQRRGLSSDGSPGEVLADGGLEQAADRAGRAAARGQAPPTRLGDGGRAGEGQPKQCMEPPEHKEVVDAGMTDANGLPITIQIAPGLKLTAGEVATMADFFESLDELKLVAETPTGLQQIQYLRCRYILQFPMKDCALMFSKQVRADADRRANQTISSNDEHFLNPKEGDSGLPIPDKAVEGALDTPSAILATMHASPVNSIQAYRRYHVAALFHAFADGKHSKPAQSALAEEAFGLHYLTDSFAGGHLKTERTSIRSWWDAKIPMFVTNLREYLAERIATGYQSSLSTVMTDNALNETPRWGVRAKVQKLMSDSASGFTFGDMVSGVLHDLGNHEGVEATIGDKPEHVSIYGDASVGAGAEAGLAVKAVSLSSAEVQRAWALGQEGKDQGYKVSGEPLIGFIKGLLDEGCFASEKLIPKPVEEKEEDGGPAWKCADVDQLFALPDMQKGLPIFVTSKLSLLDDMLIDQDSAVQKAFQTQVAAPLKANPARVLREVINWTPTLGADESPHAERYCDGLRETKGGAESLTYEQRVLLLDQLIKGLEIPVVFPLSITVNDKSDILLILKSAPDDEVDYLISRFGWHNLQKLCGEPFEQAFGSRKGQFFTNGGGPLGQLDALTKQAALGTLALPDRLELVEDLLKLGGSSGEAGALKVLQAGPESHAESICRVLKRPDLLEKLDKPAQNESKVSALVG